MRNSIFRVALKSSELPQHSRCVNPIRLLQVQHQQGNFIAIVAVPWQKPQIPYR
jgi:hypothetical protein